MPDCARVPASGWRTAYPRNTRGGWVSLAEARALGYEPRDDSEPYAADLIARLRPS